jgi:hypothetical protein
MPDSPRVLRPEDRSDAQQKTVDEQRLNELPDELAHSHIFDSKFIGVPNETTVFNVYFEPDSHAKPGTYAIIPPEWLKKAQNHGWEITHAHTLGELYHNRSSRWLGTYVPVLGSLLSEDIMTVRVHRRTPYLEERDDDTATTERARRQQPKVLEWKS